MSDLNVAVSPTGLVSIENERASVDAVKKSQQVDKTAAEETSEQAPKAPSQKEVSVALEEVSAFVQSMQRNLSFTIDEHSGEEIISVTDAETQEVIRQIPSEELVVLRKKMDDVVGILFDTKV